MRVLVTSHPGLGHLNGIVPLALGLRAAGHDVLAVGAPSVADAFARAGVDSAAVVEEPLWSDADETHDEVPGLRSAEADRRLAIVHAEIGIRRRAFALLEELPAVVETWRPTVLLRDATEFAAWIVAEREQLPDVSFEVSVQWSRDRWDAEVGQALRELRDRAGLATPDAGPTALFFRHMHVDNAPPSLRDAQVPLPATTVHLAPTFFEQYEPDRVVHGDGGHVYMAFGTVYRPPGSIVDEVAGRLAALFPQVLVVGGRVHTPGVVARPYIDQTPAMAGCAVVVCHGGRNTVLTALRHGIPVVCIPMGSDHFEVTALVERCGAGFRSAWTADAIVDGARTVAGDPAYALAARAVAAEIAGMPTVADVVAEMDRRFG